MARLGADRTAQLIRRWAGGEIAPGVVDTAPGLPGPTRVAFRPARVNRLLGTDLSAAEQRELLARVGVETEPAPAGAPVTVALKPEPLVVAAGTRPPSRRSSRPGAATSPSRPTSPRRSPASAATSCVPSVTPDTAMPRLPAVAARGPRAGPRDARRRRPHRGRDDGPRLAAAHRDVRARPRGARRSATRPQPGGDPIGVTNPLSRDHSLLRRNLLGSLLDVVGVNLRHGTEDVAIFEIGKGYARTGAEPREWWRLGFALVGRRRARRLEPHGPAVRPRRRQGRRRAARAPPRPAAPRLRRRDRRGAVPPRPHGPGGRRRPPARARRRAAPARRRRLGAADHPAGHRRRGRDRRPRRRAARRPSAPTPCRASRRSTAISRSSSPRRCTPAVVEALVREQAGDLLRDVRLFDIYRGVPLAGGEKSLAFRVRFGAADRTLTEAEVEAAVAGVVGALPDGRGPPPGLSARGPRRTGTA